MTRTSGKSRGKKPSAADVAEHRAAAPEHVLDEKEKVLLPGGPEEGFVALAPFQFQMSILERRDGKLECLDNGFNRSVSKDGGRTWERLQVLDLGQGQKTGHVAEGRYANGWIRLPCQIGMGWTERGTLPGRHAWTRLWWRTSEDEGKTWSEDVLINPTGEKGEPYFDAFRVTRNGRLLLPVRWCFSAGMSHYESQTKGAGWWNGKKVDIEGHGHFPEMDITYVYYSDDEGQTWSRCEGEVMGWPYRGWANYVACDEPNLEQMKDGRLIMLLRTTIGRLLKSVSEDGGEHWSIPEPTVLASSYSPCALKRIPQTGDLLCVWNQVSADEIRLGYRRGRLSAAISPDGENWNHFRTLEAHGLLAEAGKERLRYKYSGDQITYEEQAVEEVHRIFPEEKQQLARALSDVGAIHPDFGVSDYPTIAFHGEEVLIGYVHVKGLGQDARSSVKLRILPVQWFYE
jgi:hypothetical protein